MDDIFIVYYYTNYELGNYSVVFLTSFLQLIHVMVVSK